MPRGGRTPGALGLTYLLDCIRTEAQKQTAWETTNQTKETGEGRGLEAKKPCCMGCKTGDLEKKIEEKEESPLAPANWKVLASKKHTLHLRVRGGLEVY